MIRPSFTIRLYRNNLITRKTENILAVRPTAGYKVACFLGDGSGPWVPDYEATKAALPWALRSAFTRGKWSPALGIDVMQLVLWSTRDEALGCVYAKLIPQPQATE